MRPSHNQSLSINVSDMSKFYWLTFRHQIIFCVRDLIHVLKLMILGLVGV